MALLTIIMQNKQVTATAFKVDFFHTFRLSAINSSTKRNKYRKGKFKIKII